MHLYCIIYSIFKKMSHLSSFLVFSSNFDILQGIWSASVCGWNYERFYGNNRNLRTFPHMEEAALSSILHKEICSSSLSCVQFVVKSCIGSYIMIRLLWLQINQYDVKLSHPCWPSGSSTGHTHTGKMHVCNLSTSLAFNTIVPLRLKLSIYVSLLDAWLTACHALFNHQHGSPSRLRPEYTTSLTPMTSCSHTDPTLSWNADDTVVKGLISDWIETTHLRKVEVLSLRCKDKNLDQNVLKSKEMFSCVISGGSLLKYRYLLWKR